MSYRDEMVKYLNGYTGLFGYMPNEAVYSTGNPLLDTGTAYVVLSQNDAFFYEDANNFEKAVQSCSATTNKYLSKIPATDDNISHDDIIGIVAGYASLRIPILIAGDVINPGKTRGILGVYILSTSGKFYWDALVKPWHKAFYLMAANCDASIFGKLSLSVVLVLDAMFNKSNTSDKKLNWLITKSIKGKSKLVDIAINFWQKRLQSVFGGIQKVFSIYYGPDHVLTKYVKE